MQLQVGRGYRIRILICMINIHIPFKFYTVI
jgi:hypothetical protein